MVCWSDTSNSNGYQKKTQNTDKKCTRKRLTNAMCVCAGGQKGGRLDGCAGIKMAAGQSQNNSLRPPPLSGIAQVNKGACAGVDPCLGAPPKKAGHKTPELGDAASQRPFPQATWPAPLLPPSSASTHDPAWQRPRVRSACAGVLAARGGSQSCRKIFMQRLAVMTAAMTTTASPPPHFTPPRPAQHSP